VASTFPENALANRPAKPGGFCRADERQMNKWFVGGSNGNRYANTWRGKVFFCRSIRFNRI